MFVSDKKINPTPPGQRPGAVLGGFVSFSSIAPLMALGTLEVFGRAVKALACNSHLYAG
jgi:hypothetical protein